MRSDFEVTCFAYEGIDAIKAALAAGIACGTETNPISLRLIAPPLYVMTTNTLDQVSWLDFNASTVRYQNILPDHIAKNVHGAVSVLIFLGPNAVAMHRRTSRTLDHVSWLKVARRGTFHAASRSSHEISCYSHSSTSFLSQNAAFKDV